MAQREQNGLRFEDGGFLALIILVSLAFAWLIEPFFGAVLWGLIAAIVGAPIYRALVVKLGGRRNLAAALMLVLILALVILPATLLAISLVQEAAVIYTQLQEGEINLAEMFAQIQGALPQWALQALNAAGLTEFETVQGTLRNAIGTILESIASRALIFGQGALELLASLGVMLYLTFFLLRDGEKLAVQVKAAMPLRPQVRDRLIAHFTKVIRATMKGTIVVGALQGLAGGLVFWAIGIHAAVLWGLLMALFSLFPAVGTGIVWVPVAIYLFATGSIWEGIVLVFCGFFVIGLIDNILRPILVGHDTRLPEFVILIATVAGLDLLGLTGVIVGPIIAALFISVWKIASELRAEQPGSTLLRP